MLKSAGGAAGTGLGLAGVAGKANAGCKTHPPVKKCPKCDEEKGGPTRYLIAHRPPGNPENCQTLCLPKPAAETHLEQHGEDTCGPCPDTKNGQKTDADKNGKSNQRSKNQ